MAGLLLLVLIAACSVEPADPRPSPRPEEGGELAVAFLAPDGDPRVARFRQGAAAAAEEVTAARVLGRPLRVVPVGPPTPTRLAALADDAGVIGAVTVGGLAAIAAAGEVLDDSRLAVVEMIDDLYDLGALRPSVFQAATPHSWQAWRLARYFGPGDRRYSRVGLLRASGPAGDAAAAGLAAWLQERLVAFVDAAGEAEEAVAHLAGTRPEAVVVEGPAPFVSRGLTLLGTGPYAYRGRGQIVGGWRPQVGGFETLLAGAAALAGTVAVADYAFLPGSASRIPESRRFQEAFRRRFGHPPRGDEAAGYDAVRALAEGARRAGWAAPGPGELAASRRALVDGLELFDRVRFARLPVSLGPDDHLLAERDVQGIWAATGEQREPWLPVMRTFTSDLERTNVLEADWPAFFEGTVPGGEAPFYHQARYGIVSDPSDDRQ